MESSAPNPKLVPPAFAAAFRTAAGSGNVLRFDAFMELALYHPELGYYRRERPRVGRARHTDFYTATSLGPIFGQLIAAAAAKLLREAGRDPAAHVFVEIGAEPSGGVLSPSDPGPFSAVTLHRIGEPLNLAGPCVVFSNELFDAQPVRRFARAAKGWIELGVALSADGQLHEVPLGPAPEDAQPRLPDPTTTPEGYHFDAPLAAAALATHLAHEPWHGLFLTFDYGKSFAELGHAHPAGTLRAYRAHRQSNDLLAHPGEQDLTAHICWDWLTEALAAGDCHPAPVQSQEAFFVHHAADALASTLTRTISRPSDPTRRTIQHLLHPAQMGQKFQVLHALKPPPGGKHTLSPETARC